MTALVLLVALALPVESSRNADATAYVVVQAFPLQPAVNGVEGTVQLLLDARLTKPLRDSLWGRGEWSLVLAPESKPYKDFSNLPPAKPRLRIINKDGKVIVERSLRAELAKLEPWDSSSGAGQVFLLTEDYSAGFGSYNGLETRVFNISDGSFQDVTALDVESHQEKPITLLKSLKSDWRVTLHTNNEGEILSVSCRPKNGENFTISYVRYRFQGTHWLEYRREADGFWESDQPFPESSAFP
jgi:hypothetical protein